MRNLNEVFNNCIMLVEEAGICDYGNITDVTVNTRAKKRWGQTRKCGIDNMYSINISSILLDEKVPIEALQNTIIHEILHTCPDCFNHGKEWQRRAKIIKKNLGYNIKRCSGAEEKGISETILRDYGHNTNNYVVRCVNCGNEIKRERMSKLIKYPYMWKCGRCGGEFKRIK